MPPRRRIWLRRAALMAIVGVVVAIPITLLVRGDSGEDQPATATPRLNPMTNDRGLRVGYRVPRGWRQSKEGGVLRLQSRDGSVLIAVAAPTRAGRANQVRRDIVRGIRESYRQVEVRRGGAARIGGLDARSVAIRARQPGGGELRILVAAASGDRRTYVVETFAAANARPQRLRQAQAALNALRLRG